MVRKIQVGNHPSAHKMVSSSRNSWVKLVSSIPRWGSFGDYFIYDWHFWSAFFYGYARIHVRPSFLKWFSIVGMIWSLFFFRFQRKPKQRRGVAVALLEVGSALSLKFYHVSGMLGASMAQVCQRISIIWLSLLFLFALVDACFCFVWCT